LLAEAPVINVGFSHISVIDPASTIGLLLIVIVTSSLDEPHGGIPSAVNVNVTTPAIISLEPGR